MTEAAPPVAGGARRAPPLLFPWRLVTHQKGRTAIAAAAIAFSVLVMFMQLGFYGATVDTAVALPGHLRGDLFLVSNAFVHLAETGTFPRRRLTEALGAPGVARATALYTRLAFWRAIEGDGAGPGRSECFVQAFAYDPADPPPLDLPELPALRDSLVDVGAVAVDVVSQPLCPPAGADVKIDDQIARVAGRHRLGMGFMANGSLVMGDATFVRLFPEQSLDRVSIGVLSLAPGRDPAAVAEALRGLLPPDTEVVTASALRAAELHYWVDNTAVGNIFGIGTAVGFFVGLVVVYQVLSASIRNQLPQFAVMRAIGCSDLRIYGAVLVQGWLLTLFGYAGGALAARGMYAGVEQATLVPMPMPITRLAFVLGLSLVLATFSALLSLRKLESADPAALF